MDAAEKNIFNEKHAGTAFTLAALLPYAAALIVSLVCMLAGAESGGTAMNYATLISTQISYLAITAMFARHIGEQAPTFGGKAAAFGVGKFDLKYLAAAVILAFGLLFGLGYLNIVFVDWLTRTGLGYNNVSLPLAGAWEFIFTLIFVGILPAIFEELIFRGIILRGLSACGAATSIFLSAALFALFHQNPAQTIYQFVTGCVFALIALRSGSVVPSTVMHLINNVAVLFFEYFAPEAAIYDLWTVAAGAIAFIAGLLFVIFYRRNAARGRKNARGLKDLFIYGGIGIAVCAAAWVAALVI